MFPFVCVIAHEVNRHTLTEHNNIVTVGNWARRVTHTHTHTHRTGTESTSCFSRLLFFYSYAGRVVGSTSKAQRENPEMTVRSTDPVLKGAKLKLEQLTQVHTHPHFT